MLTPQNLARLKRARDQNMGEVQRLMGQGRYLEAEEYLKPLLDDWRKEGGPREDEYQMISQLGKCLEGQRKYVEAYELYMKAINYLTGAAYDDIYSQFLYLNEKMGAFDRKPQCGL